MQNHARAKIKKSKLRALLARDCMGSGSSLVFYTRIRIFVYKSILQIFLWTVVSPAGQNFWPEYSRLWGSLTAGGAPGDRTHSSLKLLLIEGRCHRKLSRPLFHRHILECTQSFTLHLILLMKLPLIKILSFILRLPLRQTRTPF